MTRSGAGRADGVAQLIERPDADAELLVPLERRPRRAPRPRRAGGHRRTGAPQSRRRRAPAGRPWPRTRAHGHGAGDSRAASISSRGLVVGQRAGLARRRRGLPGVLAGDAAQRVGDERRLRRVGPAGGAAGGGDRRGSAPDRGQLRPLGPLGEVGGDLRRRGGEGRGPPAPRTSARTAATARHRPSASPASSPARDGTGAGDAPG